MSKVSLPFVRNGESFDPIVFDEDLATFEDAENAALKSPDPRKALRQAQREFVEHVLKKSLPDGDLQVRLTTAQVKQATHELYTKGQDWREADRPLGQGGGSSASFSPPASASKT